jgi:hypothetical protein
MANSMQFGQGRFPCLRTLIDGLLSHKMKDLGYLKILSGMRQTSTKTTKALVAKGNIKTRCDL